MSTGVMRWMRAGVLTALFWAGDYAHAGQDASNAQLAVAGGSHVVLGILGLLALGALAVVVVCGDTDRKASAPNQAPVQANHFLNTEQAADLLNTLLLHSPDRIYFKDRQSRFICVSRGMMFRRDLEDASRIIGKTDFDFYTDEHARKAFEDEQRIMATGEPIIGVEEKETWHDGSITWASSTKACLRNSEGEIIGTFGISRDITQLKQAEVDLEKAHKKLVRSSRFAGMAEVATDVLHNVGNVLNSVNVSSSVVMDRAEGLQFDTLARIPELIKANTGRLEEYLTTDPQGRNIPELIEALAQSYTAERSELIRELNELRENINHIKQVVSMQQNYARIAGLVEQVTVAEMVEDALRINIAGLDRHSIQLVRDFAEVPPIVVDKHKVLQILVNLINNAKYAVSSPQLTGRNIILRIRPAGEHAVQVQVQDNGVGISAENLVKIFSHGFTTRSDGHGFGLHSGALAARELGGELKVASDGINLGATFTLVLPLNPPEQES